MTHGIEDPRLAAWFHDHGHALIAGAVMLVSSAASGVGALALPWELGSEWWAAPLLHGTVAWAVGQEVWDYVRFRIVEPILRGAPARFGPLSADSLHDVPTYQLPWALALVATHRLPLILGGCAVAAAYEAFVWWWNFRRGA